MNSPVTINKLWWEYLVPKQLIPRRREVESLINDFIHAGNYGAEWCYQRCESDPYPTPEIRSRG